MLSKCFRALIQSDVFSDEVPIEEEKEVLGVEIEEEISCLYVQTSSKSFFVLDDENFMSRSEVEWRSSLSQKFWIGKGFSKLQEFQDHWSDGFTELMKSVKATTKKRKIPTKNPKKVKRQKLKKNSKNRKNKLKKKKKKKKKKKNEIDIPDSSPSIKTKKRIRMNSPLSNIEKDSKIPKKFSTPSLKNDCNFVNTNPPNKIISQINTTINDSPDEHHKLHPQTLPIVSRFNAENINLLGLKKLMSNESIDINDPTKRQKHFLSISQSIEKTIERMLKNDISDDRKM